MKNVYLDNNATTRVADEVIEAMMPFLTEFYGNASSMHSFGGRMRHKIDTARAQVAELIHCDPSEIIFTSCGTESDNTAIRGALARCPDKRHIITTRVEHPAVQTTVRQLQKQGYRLTELPVDSLGRLDLEQLAETIDEDTALVTIMYANNETGVVFPIDRIAALVKQNGSLFHTDAVQAVGKLPIDLSRIPIDLMSISGHKLHGPKGVGVLYVRRGTSVAPQLVGGHQESGRRAGTENVPGIVAMGKACELARTYMNEENERVRQMRDRLETSILKRCPNARINGDADSRLPNTTNISFEYIEGEAILLLLDQLGIDASSGSACTSGSLEPSHVLRAMGIPFTAVHGSIRFSLSRYNTDEEIDYVIDHVPNIINRLRQISPFTPQKDATTAAPQDRTPGL
ncbi:MAG: cysteine desulfurase NifS [Sedimentisphaerales bacterium]|nr:cysteine desulfurase NifS [Sedimentisphaerales bacterium]